MKSIITIILLVLFIRITNAQWQRTNGPFGGGNVNSFISGSGYILAATDGGIYRSTNYGNNWLESDEGLTNFKVTALAITQDGTIFAGAMFRNLYRSTDGGNSWIKSINGYSSTQVYNFAVNPGGNIFAATNDGIYRSTNKGDEWTLMNNGINNRNIYSILIDTNGYIYIGSGFYGGEIYRSTDEGNNWTLLFSSTNFIQSLVKDSNGYIYAGTGGNYIYRSTDSGQSWEHFYDGLENPDIQTLFIDSNGTIFAGTFGSGLYFSSDQGQHWSSINNGLTNLNVLGVFNLQEYLFVGTSDGIFRSEDIGNNWLQINDGLTISNVSSIAINPEGFVFAGTHGGGIYCSTDNGDNWVKMNNGLTVPNVFSLAISRNGDILAGTYHGLFHSVDIGNNWTLVNPPGIFINSIVSDSSGYIYYGTLYEGIYRSTDDGAKWDTANVGLTDKYVNGLAIDLKGNVYAGTNDSGMFRSRDKGDHWDKINVGLVSSPHFPTLISIQCINTTKNGYVFASRGDGTGIIRSTDEGDNWTQINSGLKEELAGPIVIDSIGNIFLSLYSGVYISTDNGDSWTNFGLQDIHVQAMSINKEGFLFAGTEGKGVYKCINTSTEINASEERGISSKFLLHQNYPNPFNPTTKIQFAVPEACNVRLSVYNILGQEVETLVNGFKSAGTYIVNFDASRLASGMYIYRLTSNSTVLARKMMLLK